MTSGLPGRPGEWVVGHDPYGWRSYAVHLVEPRLVARVVGAGDPVDSADPAYVPDSDGGHVLWIVTWSEGPLPDRAELRRLLAEAEAALEHYLAES